MLFIGRVVTLWAIWSPVPPSFGIFENVALWHQIGVVDGQKRQLPVTLADIGLVLAIVFIATVAVKNLPALSEILLLSSTSISSGSRYAINTLAGYVIAVAAALIVFGTPVLSWGQMRWLVGAGRGHRRRPAGDRGQLLLFLGGGGAFLYHQARTAETRLLIDGVRAVLAPLADKPGLLDCLREINRTMAF